MEPWRKRVVLIAGIIGIGTCLAALGGITWAILYIHGEKAALKRVPATIIFVDSSKRSSFGRSIKFGTYSLSVRYRDSDGAETTDSLEQTTYGFPSAGDSITLLIGPHGTIESSPFPELWIVMAAAYAGLGAVIWFFAKFLLAVFGARQRPK